MSFPKSRVVHFPDFDIVVFDNDDYISRSVLAGNDWAREACAITEQCIQGVDAPLVLDVGANLGTYSLKLGKSLLSRSGQIIAFEPQRLIFYHLCTSIVWNRLPNVCALNIALGDEEGYVDVPTSFDGHDCNYGAVSLDMGINAQRGWNIQLIADRLPMVPLQRLDSVRLPKKVDFLKIDVEGYEARVIEGATDTLENSGWPPMLVETWQDSKFTYLRERLKESMASLGYKLVTMANGEAIAVHPAHTVKVDVEKTNAGFVLHRIA
jgi:FkbM family methyltransferase